VSIAVRPLAEADLAAADEIFRLAFGKEFGVAEPRSFRGDSELVRPRWGSQPEGALGAYRGEELVGSSFAARWGSFGVLGPITVRPDCWGQGIGQKLLEPTVALFDRWALRQAALFTFAQSAKHVALYQRFGFWPQYLSAVMAKTIEHAGAALACERYSEPAALQDCAQLTNEIFGGLDAKSEIRAIHEQALGETLLLREGGNLEGFAACHVGKGSEAGSGCTFVKFAAVRPGPDAAARFARLIVQCEALARKERTNRLIIGVNTARRAAYRALLESGFRSFLHGVAMQRPDAAGYNHPESFVIDDWR
jgi:GNAT superfamily N-acetyltransferase